MLIASVTLALLVLIVLFREFRGRRADDKRTSPFRFCGLIVDVNALYGNTLITGGTASGKTAGGVKPALREILAGHGTPALGTVGGLVLDTTGELTELVDDLSSHIPVVYPGLEVRVVAPGQPQGRRERINLISPFLPARQIAAHLSHACLARVEDTSPAGSTLVDLLEACIEGLRASRPAQEVTLAGVGELLAEAGDRFGELARTLPLGAILPLHYFKIVWPGLSPERKEALVEAFQDKFGVFTSHRQLRAQFCADSTFSFVECATSNQLVIFQADPAFAAVNDLIGSMLKLRFQCEAMAESVSHGTSGAASEHSLLLVVDEVTRYLGTVEQEAGWLALSRSLRAINLWTTMDDDYLAAQVGARDEAILLQCFANRIWFASDSSRAHQRAERICRQAVEQAPKARDLRAVVVADDFAALRPEECISFSRGDGHPAVRRYFRQSAAA